jgi:single-strand DNA-binding protein
MPFHLNRVMIAGTMTRDAEVKYTPKGTAVAEIGLAINRKYKVEGEQDMREETTFVDVEAWGRTAEIIGEHCAKGHTIYIEGRLKLDQWDDKQTGQKRSKIRIVAEEFKFVSSPREDGDNKPSGRYHEERSHPATAPGRRPPPAAPKRPPADPDLDVSDDDIPF